VDTGTVGLIETGFENKWHVDAGADVAERFSQAQGMLSRLNIAWAGNDR